MFSTQLFDPYSLNKAAALTAKHLLDQDKLGDGDRHELLSRLSNSDICIEYVIKIRDVIKRKISAEESKLYHVHDKIFCNTSLTEDECITYKNAVINTIIARYKENSEYVAHPADYPLIGSDPVLAQQCAEKYLETYKKLEYMKELKLDIELSIIAKPLKSGCTYSK